MSFEKLRAAIIYIVGNCPPERLGAVKLHKVLYYADMMSFVDSGKVLTGAEYRKRPFGPTCDAALRVVSDLQYEGLIEVSNVDYFGYQKKEFRLVGNAESNVLNARECDILEKMIEFVCFDNSAKSISELSHDLPWEMVEFGEVIPYHSALHLIPNVVSDATLMWADAESKQLADQRLGAEAAARVDLKDTAHIRNGMVADMERARL